LIEVVRVNKLVGNLDVLFVDFRIEHCREGRIFEVVDRRVLEDTFPNNNHPEGVGVELGLGVRIVVVDVENTGGHAVVA
jgi:hypothetical protein